MLIQVTRHLNRSTVVLVSLIQQLAVGFVGFIAFPFHNFPSFFPSARASTSICSPVQPGVSSVPTRERMTSPYVDQLGCGRSRELGFPLFWHYSCFLHFCRLCELEQLIYSSGSKECCSLLVYLYKRICYEIP